MYKIVGDLPENARIEVAAILQNRLADSIDLMIQARHAHWNVKGSGFIALHELFDKLSEDLERYVELIAERIAQLGGIAEGTIRLAAEKSSLPEYPLTIAGEERVADLSRAIATFGNLIRKTIDQAGELKDADTVDICTEISRGADKYLWFVEAHAQALN